MTHLRRNWILVLCLFALFGCTSSADIVVCLGPEHFPETEYVIDHLKWADEEDSEIASDRMILLGRIANLKPLRDDAARMNSAEDPVAFQQGRLADFEAFLSLADDQFIARKGTQPKLCGQARSYRCSRDGSYWLEIAFPIGSLKEGKVEPGFKIRARNSGRQHHWILEANELPTR